MVIFFILVGDFILKCVASSTPTTNCVTVSPIIFYGLLSGGVLELISEIKGVVTIFKKKDNNGD